MKHAFSIYSFAAFCALFTACSTAPSNEPMAASGAERSLAIPMMQERIADIGAPEERDQLLDVFDRARIKLEKDPRDNDAWLRMSEAFITEARITGVYGYNYGEATRILDHLLSQRGIDKDIKSQALTLKATILLSEHQFDEALVLGKEAVRMDPYRAYNYGVLVDAYTELGQYDSAVVMCDKMVAIRPDLRSYSRVSYQREIHGDIPGAIDAMDRAVKAGATGLEETSWCRVQLGGLFERSGDLDKAEEQYALALAERKNYPFALAALGRVHRKRGDLKSSAEELSRAIAIMPDAHFYAELARTCKAAKDSEGYAAAIARAEEVLVGLGTGQDTRTHVHADSTDDHGHAHSDGKHGHTRSAGAPPPKTNTHGHSHEVGLEMARFELEFHKDLPVALSNAQHEFEHREANIDVNAALAAIYCAKEEFGAARMHLSLARKTGSADASLMMLEGLMAVKEGDNAGRSLIRKAFKTDPWLQHPFAEEAKGMI
jgi:tetratricopeptide (TPR) repeat protein